jgi:glutamate racemase
MTAPIGVFDSGLGGLTVLHAIAHRLPRETLLYFGDTARVPYGPKSPEVVRRYSQEILGWMLAQGVKAVVVACNTSTAHALDLLTQTSPVPVFGVIEPGARAAVQVAPFHPIGVIGTAGTIRSGAYQRAIQALAPDTEVIAKACPLLVPMVEEGWFNHPATRMVAEEYLTPVRARNIRTLVLGCTHYPLIKPLIQEVIGERVQLIDSADETARAVAEGLEAQGLTESGEAGGTTRFVVTDDPDRFRRVGTGFLGDRIERVEVVSLGAG